MGWFAGKIDEVGSIAHAFSELTNKELQEAWGEPGVAGDDKAIVATCRLFAEMCQSSLQWEESVRFVEVADIFDETAGLLKGVAGAMIDEASKVPTFMAENFTGEIEDGVYELSLTLALPDQWFEEYTAALARACDAYRDEMSF